MKKVRLKTISEHFSDMYPDTYTLRKIHPYMSNHFSIGLMAWWMFLPIGQSRAARAWTYNWINSLDHNLI